MKHFCSRCTKTWTGNNICHCAACCETFSVIAHFDSHRVRGACVDPATITTNIGTRDHPVIAPRLKRNQYDVWVGAAPDPRFEKEADEQ